MFRKGDYAAASEHAAEAASLWPGHVFAYVMLAASSVLDGDQQRAKAALERVMALAPGFGLDAAATRNIYVHDDDRARFMAGLKPAGLTA